MSCQTEFTCDDLCQLEEKYRIASAKHAAYSLFAKHGYLLIFGKQNWKFEIEVFDFLIIFLRFWLFDPQFLINFFHIKSMQ